MDNRPVGVCDSGFGGLTAVRAIRALLPAQDIIYLGDTARIPYGTKSRDLIVKLSLEHLEFMLRRGVKALVVGCGTMSTVALETLQQQSPVPVLAVTEPAALSAVKQTRNKRVGMIATPASVKSGVYERVIAKLDPAVTVFSQPCELFVPLVEAGRVHRGDLVIETVVAEYLTPLREAGIDTLLLGCTHYPLLMERMADFLGPEVTLIDSGAAVAETLCQYMGEQSLLPDVTFTGAIQCNVTDEVAHFERLAPLFLQNTTYGLANRVDMAVD